MSDRPIAIIYCDHLLYASETFIRAQASSLRRYFPAYAGLRRVPGLELPHETTYVIHKGGLTGGIWELAFKLWGVAPAFVNQLKSLGPQILHAHFGADGFRALPLARKLGVPMIVSFHGSDATTTRIENIKVPYGHRRYLANKSLLQRGAARFIAVSEFIKSKLLEQGYSEGSVKVHYIGVDTKLFSPGVAESERMVLFVGRLVERKGLDYLIRAMGEVQREQGDLELVVIGDGPLRGELETLAKEQLRRYRFLGVKSPSEVRDWLNRSCIFAAPSVKLDSGEEEGFGMVFIEAQAMQKPVVSFDSGGIREAVEHGVTGLLAPERDWRELAKHLALLASDNTLRRRFGLAGRDRVLRQFDIEKQTALLEDIYTDVSERWYATVQNQTCLT